MRDLGNSTFKMMDFWHSADKKMIENLQRNLEALRRLAGWTVQNLADEIGVDVDTVQALERRQYNMSDLQYAYLRTVLESRAETNELLKQALPILIETEEEQQYSDDQTTQAHAPGHGGHPGPHVAMYNESAWEEFEDHFSDAFHDHEAEHRPPHVSSSSVPPHSPMHKPGMAEYVHGANYTMVMNLQRNLEALRRLAGWTVQELAVETGMHVSIIQDMHNQNYHMSFYQYAVLRAALANRAESNDLLRQVIPILIELEE